MKYDISIIIPIFNAENTIRNAIDSIIRQTIGFENIELILVDDKSTDSSREIIEEYCKEYDNIKPIFLKENSGTPAKPRNIGLDNATADYIVFIDNDDSILEDYCETLYEVITKEDADIVHCNKASKFLDGFYADSEISKEYCEVEDPLSLRLTAWANMFKKKLIDDNNIRFPKYVEDVNFAIVAYTKADRIIHMPHYHGYLFTVEDENMSSLSHTIKKSSIYNTITGYEIYKKYLEENNLNKVPLLSEKVNTLYLVFFKFSGPKKDKIELLKAIREFEKSLDFEVKIPSKPIDVVNSFVMNENYGIALILSSIASALYKNRRIKNFIFRRTTNLKKIEI